VSVTPARDIAEDGAGTGTGAPELLGERSGAEDVGLRAHERRRQALDRRRRQHERPDGCRGHEDPDRDRRGQPSDLAGEKRSDPVPWPARGVMRSGREMPQE
jgi:hypothetical protein